MLGTKDHVQKGFALLPVIVVAAALIIAGTAVGTGVYLANKNTDEVESLTGEISALKERLEPTPSVSPAPSPEISATPTPTSKKSVPKVQAATTSQVAPNPQPTVTNVVPSPAASTPPLSKREQCEQPALSAKSKYVLQLEEMKAKYQPEHDKNYYSLLAQGRYQEAAALQAQWQQAINNINNSMAHAYDIALAGCLAGEL